MISRGDKLWGGASAYYNEHSEEMICTNCETVNQTRKPWFHGERPTTSSATRIDSSIERIHAAVQT